MKEGINNKFLDNALIYVYKRPTLEGVTTLNWAALGDFVTTTEFSYWSIDQVEVKRNIGQGSEDTGFLFMAAPCEQAANHGFMDNTVSSTIQVGLHFRQAFKQLKCSVIQKQNAFHCGRGLMASLQSSEVRIQNIVLVENKISLVIKTGTEFDYNNAMQQQNWFISALARPDCPKCYNAAFGDICKNQFAYQLGIVAAGAFPPPLSKASQESDILCGIERIDCRIFVNNATFHNFKQTYLNIPQCSNNAVFTTNPSASDSICSNFFQQSQCVDCDKSKLFSFRSPSAGWRGWFGGCGSFDCTGPWNFLIQDMDGKFLGKPKQVIPNNPWFGPTHSNCVKQDTWNGYECEGTNIGVLQWLSIAPDYNQRLFSPVYIRKNGVLYNQINSFKEWAWQGTDPGNKRESKFLSLVDYFTTVDMENAGQNPSDAKFFLSSRIYSSYQSSDWVIVRLKYSTPQVIQVLKNDNIITPFPIKDGNIGMDLTKYTGNCGANNYYYKTNLIEFVVTGALDCIVRVRQVNNLMITTHLSFDYDCFFKNDRFGSFATKVIAFLGIDPDRVKIVGHSKNTSGGRLLQTGLMSGSTNIQVTINTASAIGEANTPDGKYDPSLDTKLMDQQIDRFKTDQPQLSNSCADLKADIDPPLKLEYLAMGKNVANNVVIESTEKPTTTALDLFVFNDSYANTPSEMNEGISIKQISTTKQLEDQYSIIYWMLYLSALLLGILLIKKIGNRRSKSQQVAGETEMAAEL